MKSIHLLILFSLQTLFLWSQKPQERDLKSDHRAGEILVQFIDNPSVETFFKNQLPFIQRFEWLVEPLSIGRIFLDAKTTESYALTTLRKHPSVRNAQLNHILENRATPNDPLFPNQWMHKNAGLNGAVADADIDSDEAWDITHGGKTIDGDSIVVAVIDDGINLSHSDLQQNLWLNRREIPNNGIDDDRNGYIDDYRGWNAVTQSDAVEGGTHGVEVSGVIGAVGNNSRGVSGVNWSVKIMSIVSDGAESSIVSAYGYALAQRRLFNRTAGQKGAFVVVTNSSFGASNKFPADAPIWCAMYDSLGVAGILSIGATANSPVNVDDVGDLPSTCPSPYTIIVTSSNDRDLKASDAAFGPIHVDVAAPGVTIWTTVANGDYGPKSGTSFACPVVSGIAALAYSVNCSDFINLAKSNPAVAVLILKNRILNAVETKPDLQGKIVTNGRVNAKSTIQLMQSYCGSCQQPSRISANTTVNSATISMSILPNTSLIAFFRKRGTTTWTRILTDLPPLSISNLESCTEYELGLEVNCQTAVSSTFIFIFKTDGCCSYPDNVLISNVLNNQISIQTTRVTAATGYRVCFKESPTAPNCALTQTFSDTNFTVINLKRCQSYQLSVSSVCANGQSRDTILTVKTKGCGACLDSTYCRANGSTASEWIDSFAVADFKIVNGKSNGYVRYDSVVTELGSGKIYRLGIKPAYDGAVAYNESARVWIDFNMDGDFNDAGEQIAEIPRFNTAQTVNFTMPTITTEGISRLRVALKYTGFSGSLPLPCESFGGGEVEDYCVSLKKTIGIVPILRGAISVFPNPFDNQLTIKNTQPDQPISALTLLAVDGRVVYHRRLQYIENELVITNFPPLSKGVYFLKVETSGGSFAVKLVK